MSDKAPHATSPVGAAGIARQTDAGKAVERAALLAQAKFYRAKGDLERATECDKKADAIR